MDNCTDVIDHLYEFINQRDVNPDLASHIQVHLRLCRKCYTRYDFEVRLLERLRRSGACTCPDTVKKRIQNLLDAF